VIPETATEWYQFTCACCQAMWTSQYEVRRVTDDAGQVRAFYMSHGLPCDVPALAQAACPGCGHAPVRAELLSIPPGRDLPVPSARRQLPHQSAPHCYGALDASRRFTFKAIVSLDRAGWHPRQPVAQSPEETRSLVVHVQAPPDSHDAGSFLPAVIVRDDEQPLRPGDSYVIVTISVPSGEASRLFSPGSHFALWAGTDVGHGAVSRRVVFA
jgi:hypothetical protein